MQTGLQLVNGYVRLNQIHRSRIRGGGKQSIQISRPTLAHSLLYFDQHIGGLLQLQVSPFIKRIRSGQNLLGFNKAGKALGMDTLPRLQRIDKHRRMGA